MKDPNLTEDYQRFIEDIMTRILSSRYQAARAVNQEQSAIITFRSCARAACTIKKDIKTHKNLILQPLVVKLSQRFFEGLVRAQYIGSVIHG
jgi:hypothetical protein